MNTCPNHGLPAVNPKTTHCRACQRSIGRWSTVRLITVTLECIDNGLQTGFDTLNEELLRRAYPVPMTGMTRTGTAPVTRTAEVDSLARSWILDGSEWRAVIGQVNSVETQRLRTIDNPSA